MQAPSAMVLAYHSVGPAAVSAEVFRAQMGFLLQQQMRFLSLAQLGRALESGELPEGSVCVTFNDDFEAAGGAVSWLLERGGEATLFVVADQATHNIWDADDSSMPRRRRLSFDRIRELVDAGASIGSHTIAHGPLDGQDDAGLRHQLFDSRRRLVEQLRAPVTAVAYPGGRFDTRVVRAASGMGYELGFTLQHAFAHRRSHPLMIPRLEPRTLGQLVDLVRGPGRLYYRAASAAYRSRNRLMLWRRS